MSTNSQSNHIDRLDSTAKDYLDWPEHIPSPQIRGSLGHAFTGVSSLGFEYVVCSAADLLLSDVRSAIPSAVNLDRLRSTEIAVKIEAAMNGIPELVEVEPTREDLYRYSADMSQWFALSENSRVSRQIVATANAALEEMFSEVTDRYSTIAYTTPYAIEAATKQARAFINDLRTIDASTRSLDQLRAIGNSIALLSSNRNSALAPHLRDRVLGEIKKAVPKLVRSACANLALHVTNHAMRRETASFLAFLDEVLAKGARCRNHFTEFCAIHKHALTEAQKTLSNSAQSICVPVPGHDEAQLWSILFSSCNCADQQTFRPILVDLFTEQLRAFAADRYPNIKPNTSYQELLALLPPQDTARSFRQLLAKRLSDSQSVWAGVQQMGVEKVAKLLALKSGVFVALERDHENLNIVKNDYLILRLPPAPGAFAQIATALIEWFKNHFSNAIVVEKAPQKEITVTQVSGVWPALADSTNRLLASEYVKTTELGLLVHNVGLVTQDGKAHPEFVTAVSQHRNGAKA